MYSANYGFAQGNNGQQQQQPVYNPNNANLQASQLLGQQAQQQAQQQQQQQQQMMYNAQQFAAQQAHYGAAPMGMGANAAMMQNGMAHMAANNGIVNQYQTPYSTSPYGAGIPISASAPPHQQSYMTPTTTPPSFQMNPQLLAQQQHQARMQPPSVSSTSTPSAQRITPYGNVPQNTPPQIQQPQFITPQNTVQPQQQQQAQQLQQQQQSQQQTQTAASQAQTIGSQTQTQAQQPQPQVQTTINNTANANSTLASPLSPGSETREKARVSLLLEINRELLMEVMRLQAIQVEAKKEVAEGEKPPEKPSPVTGKDYVECMRRLQSNLAYLAAIADRSHKPSSQIPPHPAIISAPPLSPIKPRSSSSPTTSISETISNEGRSQTLKEQYARLQALFPGVDPKKEPMLPSAAAAKGGAAAPTAQQQQQAKMAQAQKLAQQQQQQQAQQQQQSNGTVNMAQLQGQGTVQGR